MPQSSADTLDRYDPAAPDTLDDVLDSGRRSAKARGRACEGLRRLITSPGLLLTILAFVLVIGPLVFLHEMGHYLAGRLFGVKVEAFSIGFGREVFGVTDKRGTRWKFGWLPLGGYVRFAGDMNPASLPDAEWLMLPPEERAQTFPSKPVWQRAVIVAAGPVTNFIIAIVDPCRLRDGLWRQPHADAWRAPSRRTAPRRKAGLQARRSDHRD